MRFGFGLDQLRVDADLVARPANAPFQHIADTELTTGKARGYTRFATMRTVLFLIAGKLDLTRINPHAA